jgi:hypothetical protein
MHRWLQITGAAAVPSRAAGVMNALHFRARERTGSNLGIPPHFSGCSAALRVDCFGVGCNEQKNASPPYRLQASIQISMATQISLFKRSLLAQISLNKGACKCLTCWSASRVRLIVIYCLPDCDSSPARPLSSI